MHILILLHKTRQKIKLDADLKIMLAEASESPPDLLENY